MEEESPHNTHHNTPESILLNWFEEKNAVFLYEYVSRAEKNPTYRILFLDLKKAAQDQALHWEGLLHKINYPTPLYQPNLRTKLIAQLILVFGPRALKPMLASMKIRGLSVYLNDILPETSQQHPSVEKLQKNHGKIIEHQHRAIGHGGTVRAAVFGVNDGLISNAGLMLGIAGASTNSSYILLSGIAGLMAGAFSMAAGEYISMRSQKELFEYQITLEAAELEEYPEEEAAELSYIYQARGLSKIDADIFSKKMLENKTHALNTLAREELGLNPEDLGSPMGAAISSFIAFGIGALIPLLPFVFSFSFFENTTNIEHLFHLKLIFSITLTGVALFTIGAVLSLFTGRNALISGLRMLTIGGLAGMITYGIGHIIGVNIP